MKVFVAKIVEKRSKLWRVKLLTSFVVSGVKRTVTRLEAEPTSQKSVRGVFLKIASSELVGGTRKQVKKFQMDLSIMSASN